MTIREKLDKIKNAFCASQDDSMQMLVSNDTTTTSVNALLIQRRYQKKSHKRKVLNSTKEQAFENALQHAIFVGNPSLHWKLSQPSTIDLDYRPYPRESYWRGIHNRTPTMVCEASNSTTLPTNPIEPTLGDVFTVTINVLREHHRGVMCSFLAGETVAFLGLDEGDGDVWLVEAYNRTGKIHCRNLARVEASSDREYRQCRCTKSSGSHSSFLKPEQPPKHLAAWARSFGPRATLTGTTQAGLRCRSHSWPQMSHLGHSTLLDMLCMLGRGDEAKEPKSPSPRPGPTPPPSPAPPPPPPVPEKSVKRKDATQIARAVEAKRPPFPPRIVNITQPKIGSTTISKRRMDTPHDSISSSPVAELSPSPVSAPSRQSSYLPSQHTPLLLPNYEDIGDRVLDENKGYYASYSWDGYDTREVGDNHVTEYRAKLFGLEERVRQLEESNEQNSEQMEERFIRLAQGIEIVKECFNRHTNGQDRP